jgi:predicted nucleic acid-binding Zn ribbon protein
MVGGERDDRVSNPRDLEPFSDALETMLGRLGITLPEVQTRLIEEWDEIAGKPWVGRSRPRVIKDRTLVVEATSPSMVSLLRYGESSLLEALAERFGEGVVESIEIVVPGRR